MRSAPLEGQIDSPDLIGECRFVTGSPRHLRPFRRVPLRSNFHNRIPTLFACMRKAFNDKNWIIRRCRNARRSTSITWAYITQIDRADAVVALIFPSHPYFSNSEGDRRSRLGRSDRSLAWACRRAPNLVHAVAA